jgi:hypothetical protein
MSFTKIPPNMLKPLPGELVPEIVAARESYTTLLENLQHLKQIIDGINKAIEDGALGIKDGVLTGTITFKDGIVVPSDTALKVDGTTNLNGNTNLNGGVTSVLRIPTKGPFGITTVVDHVNEFSVQATGVNTILNFTPIINSNFLIYMYMRVNDGTPQITMNLQYTDAGGTQDHLILNNIVQSSNSYSIAPIFVNAIANQPITLTCSANISDKVFISASIVGL